MEKPIAPLSLSYINGDVPAVSARELHLLLGVDTEHFARWANPGICNNPQAAAGIDFQESNFDNGRILLRDYLITLPLALTLASEAERHKRGGVPDLMRIVGFLTSPDSYKPLVISDQGRVQRFARSGQRKPKGLPIGIATNRLPVAQPVQEPTPASAKHSLFSFIPKALSTGQELWRRLMAKTQQLEAENEALKPKAEFYDQAMSAQNLLSVGDMSKVLDFEGIGPTRLFQFLRANRVLINNDQNLPYQKYLDLGWCKLVESTWQHPTKGPQIRVLVRFTQKGVDGVRRMITEAGYKPMIQPVSDSQVARQGSFAYKR